MRFVRDTGVGRQGVGGYSTRDIGSQGTYGVGAAGWLSTVFTTAAGAYEKHEDRKLKKHAIDNGAGWIPGEYNPYNINSKSARTSSASMQMKDLGGLLPIVIGGGLLMVVYNVTKG